MTNTSLPGDSHSSQHDNNLDGNAGKGGEALVLQRKVLESLHAALQTVPVRS